MLKKNFSIYFLLNILKLAFIIEAILKKNFVTKLSYYK